MLSQTKSVIDTLKTAGFNRQDFSVKTPWVSECGGYGKAHVTFWTKAAADQAIEMAADLAATGNVDIEIVTTGTHTYPMIYSGTGKLTSVRL